MALILNLETSTKVCSVALARDGQLIGFNESHDENYTHSEKLTPFIANVFAQAGLNISSLDAVAVSKGPGSYTGLRIGTATAKGICYALEKPLIGIETLKSLASSVTALSPNPLTGQPLLCPMLDARRMEVYCAVYDRQFNEIMNTRAEIIDENSFSELLKHNTIYFFGDGAEKCKVTLSRHKNAVFPESIFPSAKNLIPFSEQRYNSNQFESLAYFEPYYLKDFVGKKSGV